MWLALPFQVGFVGVALLIASLGGRVVLPVAVLLVPALWVPAALQYVTRTVVPPVLQWHFMAFTTIGPYAGSALNVYGYVVHWDKVVHFDSGIMLAWLGMLAVRRVEERVHVSLPRWFALAVLVATPMAFAAAWEICEFTSDHLFGTHAQLGNTDTMTDIISATAGALVTLAATLVWRRPRSVMPASLLRAGASEEPYGSEAIR